VSHLGAAARRRLWRAVFACAGGLRTDGQLPAGGCVVVANHSSHADAPAVLAALDARHRPRVAAAADYWFRSAPKAAVCRTLVAGFPVRRTGGGYADLAARRADLHAGRAVVIFPAGTRTSAELFHAGAFRLAAAYGVPVVPVGVVGTATMLPPHGPLHRGRITVRIGAPVVSSDVDAAARSVRTSLDALTQPDLPPLRDVRRLRR
jgi:1-acyl-sn-glycerol-3-phosphate acyltransferase